MYETAQETSVSCTQLVVLYAPFQFGSEYNFLGVVKVHCVSLATISDNVHMTQSVVVIELTKQIAKKRIPLRGDTPFL